MFKRQPIDQTLPPPLIPGLVGYWPIFETGHVYDQSGRGVKLNSVLISSAVGIQTGTYDGLAYHFDGTGGGGFQGRDLSPFALPQHLNFSTGSFSVVCWVLLAGVTPSFPGLVSYQTSGRTGWGLNLSSGQPYFEIQIGGSPVANAVWGSSINDTRWHLIAGVLNRTTQIISVSVDNRTPVTASSSGVGDISSGVTGNFRIGSRAEALGSFANKFIGKIRDVGIWNRSLTRSEIDLIWRIKQRPRILLPQQHILNPQIGGAPPSIGIRQTAVSTSM
jgi:hypothetical protein